MSEQQLDHVNSIVSRHESTLQMMHNHAIAKSHKVARQVYNRQSRNIAKFIQQQLLFQRKLTQKPLFSQHNKLPPKRQRFGVTLRYEEDQALEHSYDNSNKPFKHQREMALLGPNNSVTDSASRLSTYKTSKKSFLRSGALDKFKYNVKGKNENSGPLPNRKKTLSFSNPRVNVISKNCQKSPSPSNLKKHNLRRRVITQFDLSPRPEDSPNQPQKIKKVQSYGAQKPIIVMSRQKMNRFIKNLHKTSWMAQFLRGKPDNAQESEAFRQHLKEFHFDSDAPISQVNLNYMVARRYGLLSYHLEDHYDKRHKQLQQHLTSVQRQKLEQTKDYPLLQKLSQQSIFSMVRKKLQQKQIQSYKVQPSHDGVGKERVYFALPFTQFISQRQTKASIYRLVRMSPISSFRIAFSLYDKNHNGVIDEDDLLQAISLSRQMPQIQLDLIVLSNSIVTPKRSIPRLRHKTTSDRENNSQRGKIAYDRLSNAISQDIKPIAEEDILESQDEIIEAKDHSSNRFGLEKFYTFLKEKKQQKKKQPIVGFQHSNVSLTFASFCKAFGSVRPAILTDLFKFLFGAQKEDFLEYPEQDQIRSSVGEQRGQREQTIQQKWNYRLKNTNRILAQALVRSQQL